MISWKEERKGIDASRTGKEMMKLKCKNALTQTGREFFQDGKEKVN
jgi:hypothetical protein